MRSETLLSRFLRDFLPIISNFISGIFQQVMHELGIKQYRSSVYHPENQDALERFHKTLTIMIRSYCFDTEKDWDEVIQLLLLQLGNLYRSVSVSAHLS